MKRHALVAVAALVACRPTASVERTTPVASLQMYRSVLVRVGGQPEHTAALEHAVASELRARCALEVFVAGQQVTEEGGRDLTLDLTIQRAARGGDGLLQNPNQAQIDVLLVLSDGIDGELVGSAKIHGESPAVLVQGGATPEEQAIDVVGRTIGEVLQKSGCGGARAARPSAPVPPGPDGTAIAGSTTGGDAGAGATASGARAQADAANEAGKQKFRTGDPAGALVEFRRAMGLVRDPRYAMNVCLAHEALEQWDEAIAACDEVIAMSPPAALADKARQRLAIVRQRRGA